MLNRRTFIAGAAVLALAGCETPSLVEGDVADTLRVTGITVDMSSFEGITGRQFTTPNMQVKQDIESSLASTLLPASADGTRPVSVNVKVQRIALVSPGQSFLVGGISTVTAQLTVIDAQGQTIVPTTSVFSSGEGYAPGGLIGAATRQSPEQDYASTVRRFGEAVRRQLLGDDDEA